MKKILNLNRVSDEQKAAINFMCVHGFMWFAWAFTCYGTAFLQNIGFSASTIGTLNATCSAVAIFSMMFWGMLSDKINSVKKTLIIATTGSVVLQALIPFLPIDSEWTVLIFFIQFPLIAVFRNSICPLIDSFSVRVSAEKNLNYSRTRSFGSFTFTIGSLLVTWVIAQSGDIVTAYRLCGILYIPAIISLFFAPDCKAPIKKGEKISISPKPLLKSYHYMALLVLAVICYTALSAEFSFITYFMEDIGVSNSNLGIFLAVRALSEIPSLLIVVKLRKKIKLKYVIMCGFSCMGLQCVLFSLVANSTFSMMAIACLFGMGNGMLMGSIPFYLFSQAPKQLKATAQTIYSAVASVSGIIGNLIGGFIFEMVDSRVFYMGIAILLFIGVFVFFLSLNFGRHIKNPGDFVFDS